jgi:phospholipase A1
MRRLALLGLLALAARAALAANEWAIVSATAQAEAGAGFEIVAIAGPGAPLPEELVVRLKVDATDLRLAMKAIGVAAQGRRTYGAIMPPVAVGTVTLQLADHPSNVLVLAVKKGDAVAGISSRTPEEREPPLSEYDPMYFIAGSRGPTTARFQISLKYRLFDAATGFGQDQPWLSGLYFGYTQNSLWDLSSESKAFRNTSYRPSLFWKWERTGERKVFDGARLGFEHESNGGDADNSRSIHILFVRPEFIWRLADGASLAFTPKAYAYLEKEENPDIGEYRGYVDWRVRFDSGSNWIATGIARIGNSGKGSMQLDVSRRTRDIRIGSVSTYLHAQVFAGYGEDIMDYNVKRRSQIRVGVAIVP